MPKFRKKPTVVTAVRFDPHESWPSNVVRHPNPDRRLLDDACGRLWNSHGLVHTLEGDMVVCPGDWVITGIKGETYPCKPDIFEKTYEPVGE